MKHERQARFLGPPFPIGSHGSAWESLIAAFPPCYFLRDMSSYDEQPLLMPSNLMRSRKQDPETKGVAGREEFVMIVIMHMTCKV